MAYSIIKSRDGSGPAYLVFKTLAEAEQECANQRYHGNEAACVTTLNSVMMTSDPSPTVINVTHIFPADYAQRGAIRV